MSSEGLLGFDVQSGLAVAITVTVLGMLMLAYKHPTGHGAGKDSSGRSSGPSRKKGVNHLPPEKRPGAFRPKKGYGKDNGKKK